MEFCLRWGLKIAKSKNMSCKKGEKKLEKEDIEKMIPLRVALQKHDSVHGKFVVDEEKLADATRAYLKEAINRDIFMFGGFVEEELVSICGFQLERRLPYMKNLTGRVAFVTSVFTKEEYRRNGYQKTTFQMCMDYAKSLEIVRFELSMVNPKAIRMYEQFGFEFNKNAMKLKLK